MPPKQPESRGWNLNTALLVLALLGAIWSTIKIGGPLLNVPESVASVQRDMGELGESFEEIRRTQAVQTEALKTLADVAKDSREMRRDVDKNRADLDSLRRRLELLEGR